MADRSISRRPKAPAAMLLACFLLGVPLRRARGQTRTAGPVDEFTNELDAYSRELENLPPPAPECRAAYSSVYAKDPLVISVFFGFINTTRKNYVADGDFKRALVRRLTEGCRGDDQACGFAAADGDPSIPNETTLFRSLDKKKVVINVFDSSVGSDYSADVGRLSDAQELKSRTATEEYLAALRRDAVVLYAGHSRYGDGSGFYPPLSFSKIGLAAAFRPALFPRINDALRSAATPPAILGMFSCHSREYYAGRMHALAPGTGLLVGSESSSHEESLLGVLGALDAVLRRSCYGEAERSFNSDRKLSAFHLYGVFPELPHPHYTRYHNALHAIIALFFIPVLMILVSRWTKLGEAPWPAKPDGVRTGAAVLFLSLGASMMATRALGDRMTSPLPFFLSLLGFLLLAIAMGRGRMSKGQVLAIAREALPFLLAPLLIYFCLSFVRELSVENALSALRQSLKLSLVFYLILPFVLFSEEVLFVPYLGEDRSGFIPSLIMSLFFYLAVWLALCWLAPVFKPALWPLLAALLFNRTFSFLLHRRKAHFLIPAVFQAVTLALIFTEGIHDQIYR